MKQVWIDDTCVACGLCVEICPEVFELKEEFAAIKQNADLSLDKKIIEAEESCPAEAIHSK